MTIALVVLLNFCIIGMGVCSGRKDTANTICYGVMAMLVLLFLLAGEIQDTIEHQQVNVIENVIVQQPNGSYTTNQFVVNRHF